MWGAILGFISFWIILFTGRYPQSFFEFQVGLTQWQTRLNARIYNLADGYPAFGISATDDSTNVVIPYPEKLSRGTLLLKLFFGWIYVLIPHGFVLFFLSLGVMFALFIGWWIILFTGQLPVSIHNFIVGSLRWSTRVRLYMGNMTDTYPPFSLD
jgi:magnesium-transporting ATPase (P-type)